MATRLRVSRPRFRVCYSAVWHHWVEVAANTPEEAMARAKWGLFDDAELISRHIAAVEEIALADAESPSLLQRLQPALLTPQRTLPPRWSDWLAAALPTGARLPTLQSRLQ